MPKAWFICDRSGFRFPYEQRIIESTGFVVGPTESDGAYDLKSHPQNKSPVIREKMILKDARPDTVMATTSTTSDATWTPDDTVILNP
jgi:hypothetical protein